jgi:hypothetical protein
MFSKLLIVTSMASAMVAAPVHAAPAGTLKIVQLDMEGGGGTLYVTPEGVRGRLGVGGHGLSGRRHVGHRP